MSIASFHSRRRWAATGYGGVGRILRYCPRVGTGYISGALFFYLLYRWPFVPGEGFGVSSVGLGKALVGFSLFGVSLAWLREIFCGTVVVSSVWEEGGRYI